jgi:transposase
MGASTYYRYRRRVTELGDEAGLKPSRPPVPLARASLEEEAAILEIVRAEPLLGAKRIREILHAASRCRDDLSERAVYATLKRHGLNRKEKRLQFALTRTDTRMARLAQALSAGEPDKSGGGDA